MKNLNLHMLRVQELGTKQILIIDGGSLLLAAGAAIAGGIFGIYSLWRNS